MKKFLIISIFIIAIFSCKKEKITDKIISVLEKPIVLKITDEIPKNSMEFYINNVVSNDKKIILNISHGGGCDPNHNFKLYRKIKANFDCHPEELYLIFTTNDYCKRLDYSEVKIDFTEEQFCSKTVIIKGGNKDLEITF